MKKTLVALAALSAVSAFAQSTVQITGLFDSGYHNIDVDKNATAKFNGIKSNGTGTSNITFKVSEDLGGGFKAYLLGEADPVVDRSTTLNQEGKNLNQAYTGSSMINGEAFVALSGNFGDIKIGTPNSPALTFNSNAQPFGTAMGSGWSSGFGRLGVSGVSGINQYVGGKDGTGRIIRSERAAVFSTPIIEGLQAQIEYSAKNGNGGFTSNDNGLMAFAANYTNGPLKLAGYTGKATAPSIAAAGTAAAFYGNPYTCTTTDTAVALTTAAAPFCKASYVSTTGIATNALAANENIQWNMISGNYVMGNTTLYAAYTSTKASQAGAAAINTSTTTTSGYQPEDSKSWNIAVKQVIGNYDFLANYLVRKSALSASDQFANATTTKPTDADGYNQTARLLGLGVNYNLSKMTKVYGRYERQMGLNAASVSAAVTNGIPAVSAYGNATQTTSAVGIAMGF